MIKNKKTYSDYIFCLLVGSIYIYSLSRTIVTGTIIYIDPLTLFVMGVLAIVFFLVVFYNRMTRRVTAAVLGLILLFMLLTLDDFSEQYPHLYDMWLMVRGYVFSPELGRSAIWLISFLLGFTVVIFMFYQFNFFVLAAGGIIVFLFSWIPGFTRDEISFYFFLIAFCILLLRKMSKTSSVLLIAAPLCALLVIFAHGWLPLESELYSRRALRDFRPTSAVEDMLFEFITPMHFSFQSTGFAGSGGRLGGPVTLNDREIMTVFAPPRTYLSGATSETFTGHSWINILDSDAVNTHGLTAGEFEMIETITALIRNATMVGHDPAFTLGNLFGLPMEDLSPMPSISHFPTLGVAQAGVGRVYMYTYMPLDYVTINIGQQRTGSFFRPPRMNNIWFPPTSEDYLEIATFSPIGDIRTPVFMSRETTYHMQFLNVNNNLSFIQYILNQSHEGLYAARGRGDVFHSISIGENVSHELTRFSHRNMITEATNGVVNLHIPHVPSFPTVVDERIFNDGSFMSTSVFNTINQSELAVLLLESINSYMDGGIYIQSSIIIDECPDENTTTIQMIGFSTMPGLFDSEGRRIVPIMPDIQNFTVNEMFALLDLFIPNASSFRGVNYINNIDQLVGWLDSFSANILADYAAQVRENFMNIPDIVPQRVFDLTMDIIEGHETDFDKIMAIRNFLLTFPYTLTPSPVPRGVCFVDHFLFEGQEGYCTYFATAMAIKSRIAGIPSRYVEGFVLPSNIDPLSPTTVTNRMAHAWAEVYLEGFGWLIVEATPTYVFAPTRPAHHNFADGSHMNFEGDDEWMRMMAEMQMMMQGGEWQGTFDTTTMETNAAEYVQNITVIERRTIGFALLACAAIILIVYALQRRFSVKNNIKKINKLTPNAQVTAYFTGILDIVTYYTKPLEEWETPKTYGYRMGKRFAFKSDSIFFKDLIDLYYKARYSANEVTTQEAELMKEAYFDMLNLLKQMRRREVYIYLRYIQRVGHVFNL